MSVISKVGTINTKAFGMILGMFMKDLYNDFDKEYDVPMKRRNHEAFREYFDKVWRDIDVHI